jgi:hypothetical protein
MFVFTCYTYNEDYEPKIPSKKDEKNRWYVVLGTSIELF